MGKYPLIEQFIGEMDAAESRSDIPIQIALEALCKQFGYSNVSRVLKNMNPKKRGREKGL